MGCVENTKIKIRFTVAYDGTSYCGWQKQNHGHVKSVAYVLEQALSSILNEKISLFASGRTDAGVHALNQVCHFETTKPLKFFYNLDFAWSVNSKLPPSIVVKDAWHAPAEFHSTISPDYKTYRYIVRNSNRPSPMLHRYAHWVRNPIDIDYLNSLSAFLIGKQDFKSFQSIGSDVPHTMRTIYKAQWVQKKEGTFEFRITGSGFLKQMVRNIVGTQLLLERTKEKPEKFKEIIELKDRSKAGAPAPPQGLYLWKVYYPLELDNKCRKLYKDKLMVKD
ncbi:MAG: tRNA pseudouridine(38-40) synthase TruA [Bdellovibrio sp. 28-41-41]|nr:MAG: tRNA pseudouridine(38-40) synthase TruA [Bdellovibrio sp. 28-41-41]